MTRLLSVLALCLMWSGPVPAAPAAPSVAPDLMIKKYRFEIRRIEYKGRVGIDPFRPGIPMRAATEARHWHVRISTLKLSSVIVGKQRVAVFKESIGPTYSYVLVNGVLVGPDHKPIPGVEGSIEETRKRGEYRVILRQGVETVVHTLANETTKGAGDYASPGSSSSGADKNGAKAEESE